MLDVTALDQPRIVPGALVPFPDARNVYVARTYAYVSAGKQGVAIVDVEQPEHPQLDQIFSDDGKLNDVDATSKSAWSMPARSPSSPMDATACASFS